MESYVSVQKTAVICIHKLIRVHVAADMDYNCLAWISFPEGFIFIVKLQNPSWLKIPLFAQGSLRIGQNSPNYPAETGVVTDEFYRHTYGGLY